MDPIRTENHLQKLIDDQIEEDARLEYKAAAALARTDGKKREITKDVSSFANAAGGILIYGISETQSADPPRKPDAIDPVDCSAISKEWLDQIIGQIQPRIPGVEIIAIKVGPNDTDYVYVVEVPQSSTVHQALDKRYYARRNFESTSMEDYEVRDVMHRQVHPTVEGEIRIVADFPFDRNSHVAVRIRNTGSIMARHYAIVLKLPLRINGNIIMPEDGMLRTGDGPVYHSVSITNQGGTPLFPGSEVTYDIKFEHKSEIRPDPGESLINPKVTLYADNMQGITEDKDVGAALTEWT